MNSKIFLIRHGLTEWNKSLRFQGSQDIELNELGRGQAKQVANRLATEKIEKVYASDLSRAYETAEIIANKHSLEVKKIAGLQEVSFGTWEGMTYDEIQEEYREEWSKWQKNPVENPIPEGESFEELQSRVMESFKQIVAESMDETILIVSHGGVIKVLLATLLEMPLDKSWRLMQSNTAVNIINYHQGDTVTLELFNSTSHLNE